MTGVEDPIQIRQFTAEDATALREVALRSWLYTYNGIYSKEEILATHDKYYDLKGLQRMPGNIEQGVTDVLVIIKGAMMVGFGQMGFKRFWEKNVESQEIYLSRLYLDPDYIGQGLGKQLLIHLEEFVHQNGRDRYFTMVQQDNEIGKKFYLKHGFQRFPDGDDDDEWCLLRQLSSSR